MYSKIFKPFLISTASSTQVHTWQPLGLLTYATFMPVEHLQVKGLHGSLFLCKNYCNYWRKIIKLICKITEAMGGGVGETAFQIPIALTICLTIAFSWFGYGLNRTSSFLNLCNKIKFQNSKFTIFSKKL